MILRCYNPLDKSYKNYGGRGIKVCQRWLESFDTFILDMGNRKSPKHSLDRINNDGNYEPSNCRWATRTEQSNNQRQALKKYNDEFTAMKGKLSRQQISILRKTKRNECNKCKR